MFKDDQAGVLRTAPFARSVPFIFVLIMIPVERATRGEAAVTPNLAYAFLVFGGVHVLGLVLVKTRECWAFWH